jgi:hypothetical protein
MAALTYINSSDRIIGANHPQFSDTKNRAGITLNANTLVEHEQTGRHLTFQKTALICLPGTYTGDGNPTKTITLSNSNLEPKVVFVWHNAAQFTLEKIDTMSSTDAFRRGSTGAIFAGLALATGQFTVSSAAWNVNLTTYYYIALGIDTTSTYVGFPAAGSDPTWITSSVLNTMIGDGTSTPGSGNIANNVEIAMNTAFGVAHNTTTGVHTTNPYTGKGKIETGTYSGNNTDNRDITLTDTSLDVKYIGVLIDTGAASGVYSRNESMTGDNAKGETLTTFSSDRIQSMGTGTFQVGLSLNGTGNTYHWYVIGV